MTRASLRNLYGSKLAVLQRSVCLLRFAHGLTYTRTWKYTTAVVLTQPGQSLENVRDYNVGITTRGLCGFNLTGYGAGCNTPMLHMNGINLSA